MRVLVVMPGLDADGGAEQSLAALLPRLVDAGHAVHLAVLSDRQALVPGFERAGAVVHDLSSAGGTVGRTRALRDVVGAVRPDVLHATLYDAAVPAQLVGRWTGVPVLVTWAVTLYDEGHFAESGVPPAKLRAAQTVEATLARLAGTRFHAVTQGVARVNRATLRVPADRVRVAERGRPEPACTAADLVPRPDGLPADGRLVLAVGRQEPQKGYTELVAAFDRLADRLPDVHLAVAGREGNDTPRLQAAQRALCHGDRVHLLGQRSDVPELLASADVVVCSSRREGAAGALIETMAAGVPIVTVALDGLEGVVVDGRNGLVVAREDLAEGLAQVLGDPALSARLGAGGRSFFEEHYSLDAAAERLAATYAWASVPRGNAVARP
ncbi:MAG: glycosyltransferase family 4 protein [Actinomycetes bacterium]